MASATCLVQARIHLKATAMEYDGIRCTASVAKNIEGRGRLQTEPKRCTSFALPRSGGHTRSALHQTPDSFLWGVARSSIHAPGPRLCTIPRDDEAGDRATPSPLPRASPRTHLQPILLPPARALELGDVAPEVDLAALDEPGGPGPGAQAVELVHVLGQDVHVVVLESRKRARDGLLEAVARGGGGQRGQGAGEGTGPYATGPPDPTRPDPCE